MFRYLNRTDTKGLFANIGLAVGAVLVVNGLIFGLGWNGKDATASTISVPGPLIGAVWTGLFAGMATARWLLLREEGGKAGYYSGLIIFLLLFCLAYPFYTLAPDSKLAGLVGNFLTIAFALFIIYRIRKLSPWAALLIGLVVVWVAFATVTIIVP